MSWRNAPAIDALKASALAAYPDNVRGSSYVGTIGDERHAASASDHNPNARGYVCAIDIGFGSESLDDAYVAALVAAKDPRLSYIISDGKMWRSYPKPGIPAWTPARYTGPNPHMHHVHVSVKQDPAQYMNGAPWRVTGGPAAPASTASTRTAPAAPVLSTGAKGAAVSALQAGLKRTFPRYAGKLVADGEFGNATKAVVAEFQRRSGLNGDGVVGPATRAALAKAGIKL